MRGTETLPSSLTVDQVEGSRPGASLRVTIEGAPSKARSCSVLLPHVGSGVHFTVSPPDVQTIVRGLLERVFFCKDAQGKYRPPITPKRGAYSRLEGFKRKVTRGLIGSTKLTWEQFLGYYSGRKLTRYSNAVDSLTVCPLQRKDSYLDTFSKAEKDNRTAKPNPSPRCIQPRHPRFNVELGCYLKHVEHILYHNIDAMFPGNHPVVMKSHNCDSRGAALSEAWGDIAHPVAVGLDAKRFDQHVSPEALGWEHSVYLRIYNQDPFLAKLLRWQMNNRGFVRCYNGTAQYTVKGSRMSGDMNTALGNVLIMCALMWTYMGELGIPYRFLNDGDDCVLIVSKRNLDRLESLVPWFSDMGFRMEREPPVTVLEKVEFCQSQPVFDGRSYRMVRQPRVALSKDLITFLPVSAENQWSSARRAIAECGLALAGDMPVLGSFYKRLGLNTDHVRPNWGNQFPGSWYLALGADHAHEPVTDEARYSFYLAFDITPDEQIALERHIDAMPPPVYQTQWVDKSSENHSQVITALLHQ